MMLTRKDRILVTGGAGMIGSNLVKHLAERGCRVSVADNLWRGRKAHLLDERGRPFIDMRNDFHQIDLSITGSLDSVMKDISYVIHLADVVAGIRYVFSNQGFVFRQNVLINSNVIAAARQHPLKGFIFVGSACSFPAFKQSGLESKPLCEADQYPAAPESAYGWSKLMGEYETFLMQEEEGIPVCSVVLHNVYGTPCDYGPETGQVIPSLARKAVRYPGEPFVVWGSGGQGRAFVHVDDAVDALVSALERGLGEGVIQIGPNTCTSVREIAESIVEISGKNIPIQYDTSKPEGDKGRRADFSKAQRILGWEPRVKLKDGLVRLYRWVESMVHNETG